EGGGRPKGLSTLASRAFGRAVYAAPGGLPHRDARLASSRWSDAPGRAFHPQGSYERFQSACLHLLLLSRAVLSAITSTAVCRAEARWCRRERRITQNQLAASIHALPSRPLSKSLPALAVLWAR